MEKWRLPVIVLAVPLLVSACGLGQEPMSGDDLANQVEADIEAEFLHWRIDFRLGSVTCDDVDDVVEGATAHCRVPVDDDDADVRFDDGFSVTVTFLDDDGHFTWRTR